jgi:ubiquitin C-terminal hydrolase
MGLRQCLLDELQPVSQPSDDPENNITYDETLHSSMVTFWDIFKGIFTQKITCTQCNTIGTTEILFRELMLKFPEEHHTSNLDYTLKQLFNHQYGQSKINNYQCNDCTRKATAHQRTFISQFPKILCIHLDLKKPDGTIICSWVAYPVHGDPVSCLSRLMEMLVHNMTSLVLYITRLEREVIVAIKHQFVRVECQKIGTNMMITRYMWRHL